MADAAVRDRPASSGGDPCIEVSAWLLASALWLGCLRPGPWWLALIGLVAVAWMAAIGRRGPCRRTRRLLIVAVAGLALAGSGLAGGRQALAAGGRLPALAARGGDALIEGAIASEPRASEHGAWAVVRIGAVDGTRTRERALLRARDLDALPEFGERIAVRATARPFEADGFGAYARRLHAWVELDPIGAIRVTGPASVSTRFTNVVRARARTAAGAHLDRDRAALLTGLVIGDTTGLSERRGEQLKDAGLAHLVAVSGANVGLALAAVLGLARCSGAGARVRQWLGLVTVGWFVLLVRAEPSVLRAGVMAALVLLARLLGRGVAPLHCLAVTVMLVLLADPATAGRLGFVLSVLATAGVLVLAPPLAARLPGPRPLRLLVAASVGAQIGVAPVLLRIEGSVPLAALPANLVAVPAAAAAAIAGGAAALAAQASVPLGGAVAAFADPALRVILWAGARFADGPRLDAGIPPAGLVLSLAALSAALLGRRRGRRRAPQAAPRLAGAVLALLVALAAIHGVRPQRIAGTLTLTALDVGQGDALLVESPPDALMLVDGGPDPQAALRHLRARGIRRLDAVALSHPHADHSGGLPAVLSALPVGAFLVGPTPPLQDAAPSALAAYRTARFRGVPVVALSAGQRFRLGAARVEVLSPPADGSLGEEPNDGSLVLHITGAAGSMLLTGDAEVAAQTRLLRHPERLRADLLKVPHHGGATNHPAFFKAVGAGVAVISSGAGNDYGHPARSVLRALRGTDLHRTDTDGTVRLPVVGSRQRFGRGSAAMAATTPWRIRARRGPAAADTARTSP